MKIRSVVSSNDIATRIPTVQLAVARISSVICLVRRPTGWPKPQMAAVLEVPLMYAKGTADSHTQFVQYDARNTYGGSRNGFVRRLAIKWGEAQGWRANVRLVGTPVGIAEPLMPRHVRD